MSRVGGWMVKGKEDASLIDDLFYRTPQKVIQEVQGQVTTMVRQRHRKIMLCCVVVDRKGERGRGLGYIVLEGMVNHVELDEEEKEDGEEGSIRGRINWWVVRSKSHRIVHRYSVQLRRSVNPRLIDNITVKRCLCNKRAGINVPGASMR
ncbi:hypothetical protein M0802_001431 [Mischocyttarus mexicanus]|nr:hypothetical protein M0802_001431 [Mischocyttarus mexicanus]